METEYERDMEINGLNFTAKKGKEYSLWTLWRGNTRVPGSYTSLSQAKIGAVTHLSNQDKKQKKSA